MLQLNVAADIIFIQHYRSGIPKLNISPKKSFTCYFFKKNLNGLTHLRHINIIPLPHQNPLQTKSLSRNLSSKPLRSTKCIEEPLPSYRSIFFVISRAWWDKSVSKRFKAKAVSLSVSPVSHFEGLGLLFPSFLLFCWLHRGCKSGLLIPRAHCEAAQGHHAK